MNTKIALTAIAIVTALALVVAPAMVEQPASAKKIELCPSGKPCPNENVEDKNKNVECTAGNPDNDHPNCPK
jgi:uncharacterized Zn-finger protein